MRTIITKARCVCDKAHFKIHLSDIAVHLITDHLAWIKDDRHTENGGALQVPQDEVLLVWYTVLVYRRLKRLKRFKRSLVQSRKSNGVRYARVLAWGSSSLFICKFLLQVTVSSYELERHPWKKWSQFLQMQPIRTGRVFINWIHKMTKQNFRRFFARIERIWKHNTMEQKCEKGEQCV